MKRKITFRCVLWRYHRTLLPELREVRDKQYGKRKLLEILKKKKKVRFGYAEMGEGQSTTRHRKETEDY